MNQIIDELTNKLSKSEDKCLQREEEMNIKYHSVMKQLSELEQSSSSNKEKKNRDIEQANSLVLDLKDQLTKHELRVQSQDELIKQLKSKISNKESEFLIEKQNSSRDYEELENKLKAKIKELDDMRSKKEIEDLLVVKLKVNTEELKTKEATIEQLRKEKELLETKVQVISETVDIKQANEENLKQEIEHFKQQFTHLAKTADEEKKTLIKKINTEETNKSVIESKNSEIKILKESLAKYELKIKELELMHNKDESTIKTNNENIENLKTECDTLKETIEKVNKKIKSNK